MAKRRQPIIPFLCGITAILFVMVVILTALFRLWWFETDQSELFNLFDVQNSFLFDAELWRIFRFTFIQAFISTILSTFLAILLAKSLYHIDFRGKSWLIRSLSLSFVLPSLVVVTGLLTVYGNQGWLAKLYSWLNLDYSGSIYGIKGILIAHLFLNFPFATKYYYQSLMMIPNQQKQLAQQLGFNYWQTFRYLEFPIAVKQLFPVCGLIFMLCFSSFAIVLALSGGPKYTTIEVAIYQSVRDFELSQAVILSFIQLIFCSIFMILLKWFEPKYLPNLSYNLTLYRIPISYFHRLICWVVIALSLIFISVPFFGIFIDGILAMRSKLNLLLNETFIHSFLTSIAIALSSAIFAMLLSISILSMNSILLLQNRRKMSQALMVLGSSILAVPSMVLSSGLFLLFFGLSEQTIFLFLLVVISNGFLALPFLLKQLSQPLADLKKQSHLLSQSLNIKGWNYLFIIEFKALKKLFLYSFSFACIMSMGDFGIVALFGSQNFMTLPYYLYELISHYHYQDASFVAMILLIISFLFITLFEARQS